MTIEECKHKLVKVEMKIKDPSERKALFMAIASLEAWEKVKAEIDAYLAANEFGTAYRQDIQAIIDNALLCGQAHWISNFKYGMYKSEKFFICSRCKEQNMEMSKYCPHCGKEMENG